MSWVRHISFYTFITPPMVNPQIILFIHNFPVLPLLLSTFSWPPHMVHSEIIFPIEWFRIGWLYLTTLRPEAVDYCYHGNKTRGPWVSCLKILATKQNWRDIVYAIHISIKLTHFPLDKMAAILQTVFADAFSWMKNFVFWLKFQWSLFLRV